MASQPFGGAEARKNNRRHENHFYRHEVVKRSWFEAIHISSYHDNTAKINQPTIGIKTKKSYLCRLIAYFVTCMNASVNSIFQVLDLTEYEHNLYSADASYPNKLLEYYKMQACIVNADYFYCFYN